MENNFITNENQEPATVTPVVEETLVEESAPVIEVTPEEPAKSDAVSTESFAKSETEPQTVGLVADGAIGVAAAKPAPKKVTAKKAEPKKEKVAIYSSKNVTWSGVGKVYTGYNIVDADEAEKWLSRNHIRRATPEEVAKEFGK